MKRILATTASLLLLSGQTSRAENSIGLSGNYYKERSTRVVEPLIQIRHSLPTINKILKPELELSYLVDQITSASGAFTKTDVAFSEFRNEVRLSAKGKLFDFITPGINLRYSHEPDYVSKGFGLSLAIDLFKKSTSLSTFFQLVSDTISSRYDENYAEELSTTALGIGVTQVVRRNILIGASVELQTDNGFQENQYRVEVHPRCRDRYSFTPWIRLRIPQTSSTLRHTYRYYQDSWDLRGHSFDFEWHQEIFKGLQVVPRFRHHTQSGTFFETRDPGSNANGGGYDELRQCHLASEQLRGGAQQPLVRFSTADPKLTRFRAQTYGLKLRWQQSWLEDSFLDVFSNSWIEPAYYYFDQQNRYGPAHIAQLNFFWPY